MRYLSACKCIKKRRFPQNNTWKDDLKAQSIQCFSLVNVDTRYGLGKSVWVHDQAPWGAHGWGLGLWGRSQNLVPRRCWLQLPSCVVWSRTAKRMPQVIDHSDKWINILWVSSTLAPNSQLHTNVASAQYCSAVELRLRQLKIQHHWGAGKANLRLVTYHVWAANPGRAAWR